MVEEEEEEEMVGVVVVMMMMMISVELISVASLFRAAESVPRGCVVQRGAMRPYLGWLPRTGPGS